MKRKANRKNNRKRLATRRRCAIEALSRRELLAVDLINHSVTDDVCQEKDTAITQVREVASSTTPTTDFYIDWRHQGADIVDDANPPVFGGCDFGNPTDPVFHPAAGLPATQQIADTDRYRFVAVRAPFWRDLMEVQVGGTTVSDVTYFRIISKLDDGNEVEVLNIFADAATRGKPEPQAGTDDSNLSSTVVVGPAQPVTLSTGEVRWAADVASAELFPDQGRVVLHYRDGGFAELTLDEVDPDVTRTNIAVNYSTETSIAVFTSMNPGQDKNADTALLSWLDESGDLSQTHIHEFDQVTGTQFVHWNNVEMTHNPSGPYTSMVFPPAEQPVFQQSNVYEVEDLTGGSTRFQSNASEGMTTPMYNGQAISLDFQLDQPSLVGLTLRYSKGHGFSSTVSASVDGQFQGSFDTVDTGLGLPPFTGWNHFASGFVSLGELAAGSHSAQLVLGDTSVWGIEADTVSLTLFEYLDPAPEIEISGNGQPIPDGNRLITTADHTHFGMAAVRGGAATRTFTVSNLGQQPLLTGSMPTFTGPHAADFSLVNPPLGSFIDVGQSRSFQVRFDPSGPGLREAVLSLANNDSDESPYDFAIGGTGIEPEIDLLGNGVSILDGSRSISVDNHTHFGSTLVAGGAVIRTYTVTNAGPAPLLLGSTLNFSGPHAADFSQLSFPLDTFIDVGESYSFQVRFDPSGPGLREAVLSLANSDSDEDPYDFAIGGLAIVTETIEIFPSNPLSGDPNGHLTNDSHADLFGPVQLIGIHRQLRRGPTLQESSDRDFGLQPRQLRAQAKVDAAAEANMGIGTAAEIDLLGIREFVGIGVGRRK